jgi:hypothetical protein
MPEYDLVEVDRLTGMSPETRHGLVRWYGGLPEALRIEAHTAQTDVAREARSKKRKDREAEFHYAMFLRALYRMRSVPELTHQKAEPSEEELARIEEIRRSRIQADHRSRPQRLASVVETKHYELIRRLRAEGLSWRDISRYIARYHKQKISHTYLKRCFDRIRRREEELHVRG